MTKDLQFSGLRKRLETLEWPMVYLFKFIVPADKADEIIRIFEDNEYTRKESDRGNYISISSYVSVDSEEEVIDIYKKAAQVEGVISL